MEIVTGAVVVTTLCAAGFVTLRGAGAAAEIMTMMFHSPTDLGWPAGVQEDDDFHWRWSGANAARGLDAVSTAIPVANLKWALGDDLWIPPEIVDLPYGAGPRPSPVVRL
ncbi:MAG TPA: hypothetical protein VGQ58_02775 [Candidatus Limnocylindrales bacterium]|jgi:hypothetical protein|nr:hypothetical protein [Candidatus Limnocylindrales bacterium]